MIVKCADFKKFKLNFMFQNISKINHKITHFQTPHPPFIVIPPSTTTSQPVINSHSPLHKKSIKLAISLPSPILLTGYLPLIFSISTFLSLQAYIDRGVTIVPGEIEFTLIFGAYSKAIVRVRLNRAPRITVSDYVTHEI